MHESKRECMKYHTQKTKKERIETPSHTLPLDLTYSLPLPLWRQAPKPKGQTMGQQQSSRTLRCGERSETELHHPQTLKLGAIEPFVTGSGGGTVWIC